MKYVLIILMTLPSLSYAQERWRAACERLIQVSNVKKEAQIVNKLPFKIDPDELENILQKIIVERINNPDHESLMQFCQMEVLPVIKKEYEKHREKNKDGIVKSAMNLISGKELTDQELQNTTNKDELDYCKDFSISFCQPQQEIFSSNVTDLYMVYAYQKTPEEKKCDCIKRKAEDFYPLSPQLEAAKKENKKKLISSVNEKFGHKFVNQYASHLEEVNYFATNAGNVFSADKNLQNARLESVRCANPKQFEKSIEKKCQGKLSPKEKSDKMAEVFKLLKLSRESAPENYFNSLNKKIMTNSTQVNGKSDPQTFTRTEFDKSRAGLVKNDEAFLFGNNLLLKLFKDPEAKKFLKAEIETEKTPAEAINRYFSQYPIKSLKEFESKFFGEGVMGKQVYKQLEENFSKGFEILYIMEKINDAGKVHPGLNSLLHNKDVFSKVQNRFDGSASVLEVLESDNLMGDVFQKRCDQLLADFSEFMCASDDDMIKAAGKNQLYGAVKSDKPDSEELTMTGLLMCETNIPKDAPKTGAFSFLTSQNPAQVESDSLERILKEDLSEHKNLYTAMMLEKLNKPNSQTANFIGWATTNSYNPNAGVKGDHFADYFGGGEKSNISFFKETSNLASGSSSYSDIANAFTPPSQNSDTPAGAAAMGQGYSNYSNPTSIMNPKTGAAPEAKEDLKEYFRPEERKTLSDIQEPSDSRLDEIWKLKEENAKFRMQLLEAANENERLKLKGIEDQIAELKRRNLAPETQVSQVQNDTFEERSSGKTQISRSIASPPSVEHNQVQASINEAPQLHQANHTSAGAASLSELKSSLSSDALSGKYTNSPVVVSGIGSHSAGLEVKSVELTTELIKYITASETDISTLERIKSSGMIYKYKVLENGAYIEKEIVLNYQNLDESVKKLLDQRISNPKEQKIQSLKRSYSYAALKIILADPKH